VAWPAEFERELITARTGEGRTRAKAAGVHMGPYTPLSPSSGEVETALIGSSLIAPQDLRQNRDPDDAKACH
jgi:DNA invertase Pin-like site-specific DNA recombinase